MNARNTLNSILVGAVISVATTLAPIVDAFAQAAAPTTAAPAAAPDTGNCLGKSVKDIRRSMHRQQTPKLQETATVNQCPQLQQQSPPPDTWINIPKNAAIFDVDQPVKLPVAQLAGLPGGTKDFLLHGGCDRGFWVSVESFTHKDCVEYAASYTSLTNGVLFMEDGKVKFAATGNTQISATMSGADAIGPGWGIPLSQLLSVALQGYLGFKELDLEQKAIDSTLVTNSAISSAAANGKISLTSGGINCGSYTGVQSTAADINISCNLDNLFSGGSVGGIGSTSTGTGNITTTNAGNKTSMNTIQIGPIDVNVLTVGAVASNDNYSFGALDANVFKVGSDASNDNSLEQPQHPMEAVAGRVAFYSTWNGKNKLSGIVFIPAAMPA